jgi:hypothetical protein
MKLQGEHFCAKNAMGKRCAYAVDPHRIMSWMADKEMNADLVCGMLMKSGCCLGSLKSFSLAEVKKLEFLAAMMQKAGDARLPMPNDDFDPTALIQGMESKLKECASAIPRPCARAGATVVRGKIAFKLKSKITPETVKKIKDMLASDMGEAKLIRAVINDIKDLGKLTDEDIAEVEIEEISVDEDGVSVKMLTKDGAEDDLKTAMTGKALTKTGETLEAEGVSMAPEALNVADPTASSETVKGTEVDTTIPQEDNQESSAPAVVPGMAALAAVVALFAQ